MPHIRLATGRDGAALAAIYAPAVAESATSFELVAPDAAEMARRVERLTERLPWLVYEEQGVVGAYAYAAPHRDRAAYQWSVEVSAYVGAQWQRRGIGRRLYDRLFTTLAELGYVNAYAGITLPNPASVGFHTAFGFRVVGTYHGVGHKFGRWHDVVWLEREIASRPVDPPAPHKLNDRSHHSAPTATA